MHGSILSVFFFSFFPQLTSFHRIARLEATAVLKALRSLQHAAMDGMLTSPEAPPARYALPGTTVQAPAPRRSVLKANDVLLANYWNS